MNIIEQTDEEILALANPMWADLVKYSNEKNYGAFTRNFSFEYLTRSAHIGCASAKISSSVFSIIFIIQLFI